MELVFDIETVKDDVDAQLEAELFGKIEPTATATKKGLEAVREYIEDKQKSLREDFALSPMTGKILCICGMLDGEEFSLVGKEKKILKDFQDVVGSATRLITFNGKGFDVPFIKIRMAKNNISPSGRLSTRRYETDMHFDVYEVLSNFGASKKGNLRQWATFFGLTPPEHDGADIADLPIEQVVEKCLVDVRITEQIYQKIYDYYAN